MADPVIIGAAISAVANLLSQNGKSTQTTSSRGTATTQKTLSQPAIDKLIYDVMSADQGLASLVGMEGASGSYGSSTKTLMAQDFLTKVIGELATVTAPTTVEKEEESVTKTKKKLSVICTELNRQGLLSTELYHAGGNHFLSLPWQTLRGYYAWAIPAANKLRTSPRLSKFVAPIAISRYEMITGAKRFTFWGAVTIFIGQPLCYLFGTLLGDEDGRYLYD